MKRNQWWRRPLMEWADTIGCKVAIHPYSRPQVHRDLGEWWVNAGAWHLHLDECCFAIITPQPDLTVRRTLTWVLGQLGQRSQPTSRTLLVSWVENWLNLPIDRLEKSLAGAESLNVPALGPNDAEGHGWFALIAPQYPRTVSLEERLELRQQVREVAATFLTDSFIGWVNVDGPSEQALLLIRDEVVDDASDAWQEESTQGKLPADSPEYLQATYSMYPSEGNLSFPLNAGVMERVQRLVQLRRILENLLDFLRQDVLVTGHMVVGAHMDGSENLDDALLTTVLLRAKPHLQSGLHGVCIWGEQPLSILLQTLPRRGVGWFLNAVEPFDPAAAHTHESYDYSLKLPDELVSSLQGLVAANLNVSEAARMLFVHRNTLIHRLDKIRELTGYDVRNFQEALVLWLSLKLQPPVQDESLPW